MKTKRIINSIIKSTPSKIRGPLLRKLYKYNFNNANDFEFTLAERFDEKVEASRIVQEAYAHSGLSAKQSELRMSKYSLLPSTFVFIAKHKASNEIVATMSLIVHTPLGLPVEEYANIKEYIKDGKRSGELSSFSVKKAFRSHTNGLSIVLMFYAMMYAIRILGMQHTFISVRDSVRYFYEDMFFFTAIGNPKSYSTVNSVKGVPMYMNVADTFEKMKRSYTHRNLAKNIYRQLTEFPWEHQCDFSGDKFGLVSRFYLQQAEIDELFAQKNITLDSIPQHQQRVLESIYFNKIFSTQHLCKPELVHEQVNEKEQSDARQAPRFMVFKNAEATQGANTFQLDIMELSVTGLMVNTPQAISQSQNLIVEFQIESLMVSLNTKVVWQRNNLLGLKINEGSDSQLWTAILTAFDAKVSS